jgi:O-antigen/teichoic acid export membrane protein
VTARNILSNWGTLLVGIVVSFFLAPYVVNKLGDAYYGLWAVLMQFTGYLNLMDFGVREAIIRNAARANARHAEGKLNRVVTVSLAMYSAIALLCILAAVGAAASIPLWLEVEPEKLWDAQVAITVTGITIGLSFIFNLFSGVLLGFQRFDVVNAINVPMQFIRAGAVVATLAAGHKIVGLSLVQLAITVLSGFGMIAICLVYLRRREMRLAILRLRWRRAVAMARSLIGYSAQVLISNIGQRITFASDALVVAAFLPVASVTYYAIAGSLIDYFRNLSVSTMQVFSPKTSHHHALREHDKVRGTLMASATLSLIVGAPVIIAYIVLGEQFIGLWMGGRFAAESGAVLATLAIGMILSPSHHAMVATLYGLGRPEIVARFRLAEAVANITLSVILVQRMGLLGVALGTTIPHLVLTGIALPWITCRITGLRLREFYGGVVVKCALVSLPFLAGCLALNGADIPNLAVFFAAVGALTALHGLAFVVVYFGLAGVRQPARHIMGLMQGQWPKSVSERS